jgi:hypothetical protein
MNLPYLSVCVGNLNLNEGTDGLFFNLGIWLCCTEWLFLFIVRSLSGNQLTGSLPEQWSALLGMSTM